MERDRDQDTTLLGKLKRARRGESNAKVLVNTLATQLKVVPLPRRRYPAATPPPLPRRRYPAATPPPLPRRRYPSSTTNPHWQIATEVYTKASVEVSELHQMAQEERVQREQQVKEEKEQEEQEREEKEQEEQEEQEEEEVIDLVSGETTVESSNESCVADEIDADEAANNEAADDDLPFGTLESKVVNVNEVIPHTTHCRCYSSTTATPLPLPTPIHHRYPTAATHTHRHCPTATAPPPLPPTPSQAWMESFNNKGVAVIGTITEFTQEQVNKCRELHDDWNKSKQIFNDELPVQPRQKGEAQRRSCPVPKDVGDAVTHVVLKALLSQEVGLSLQEFEITVTHPDCLLRDPGSKPEDGDPGSAPEDGLSMQLRHTELEGPPRIINLVNQTFPVLRTGEGDQAFLQTHLFGRPVRDGGFCATAILTLEPLDTIEVCEPLLHSRFAYLPHRRYPIAATPSPLPHRRYPIAATPASLPQRRYPSVATPSPLLLHHLLLPLSSAGLGKSTRCWKTGAAL
jgi:hypothetical protein